MNNVVTPQLMHDLTGYRASSFPQSFCDDCNKLFEDTGFNEYPEARRMLMANMMHETCNFVYLKEIASGVAYNNRSDLGNGPHDGPIYKGVGVLQLTGKYNYDRLSKVLGDPDVMKGVDYVAEHYPFTSAEVWIKDNKLLEVCRTQGFEACCVRINGGYNGYNDRLHKYQICQKYMP